MDAVNEVKSRLNIEDVIGEYVQLKRTGRNFKGLSPWTNEKTPSFIVSPEKQIWHDFSSGKGGDMISFVMDVEGLDFRAALETLARKAGVDLQQYTNAKSNGSSKRRARALEALEASAKFYQKQLIASRPALRYLREKRGFSKQTIIDWRFGYAPNSSSGLTKYLTKHGFTTDEMKSAGLVTMRRGGAADMFRGRIMIPLADQSGQIVGFTARQLAESNDSPKYINTPATFLYDKGRQVFGLHRAKEAIRKTGFVVVTEGNLDVIASHQAGITNVVASAGTAMTEMHLKALKRFSGDVRLSFDADSAGVSATERVIPLAQKVGVSLSIIDLKQAKDPDELIREDVKQWSAAVGKAKYAPDWLIEKYSAQLDLNTAAGKKAFTDALLSTIAKLEDPVEKEHYLKQVAEATDTSLEAVLSKMASSSSSSPVIRRRVKTTDQVTDKDKIEYQRLQEHFLAMVLMSPAVRKLARSMPIEYFDDGPARKLLEFVKHNPDFRGEPKMAAPLQQISDYVKIISLQFEELYGDLPPADLEEQAVLLKRRLIERYVKIQKIKLAESITNTSDQRKQKKLMAQANQLNALLMESSAKGK